MTKNNNNTKLSQTTLDELTRWRKRTHSRERLNYNTSNIVNLKPNIPQERINQALSDYSSGNFPSKKEVAKKHKISTQTLINHAKTHGVKFLQGNLQPKVIT